MPFWQKKKRLNKCTQARIIYSRPSRIIWFVTCPRFKQQQPTCIGKWWFWRSYTRECLFIRIKAALLLLISLAQVQFQHFLWQFIAIHFWRDYFKLYRTLTDGTVCKCWPITITYITSRFNIHIWNHGSCGEGEWCARSLATGCSTNTIKMFAIKSNQSSIGTLRRRSVNYTQRNSIVAHTDR